MKTRMTAADVAAEVACLQAAGVHGMRLANVYDLNARTYLLKLNRSAGDTGEGQKVPPPLHRLRIAPSLRCACWSVPEATRSGRRCERRCICGAVQRQPTRSSHTHNVLAPFAHATRSPPPCV